MSAPFSESPSWNGGGRGRPGARDFHSPVVRRHGLGPDQTPNRLQRRPVAHSVKSPSSQVKEGIPGRVVSDGLPTAAQALRDIST